MTSEEYCQQYGIPLNGPRFELHLITMRIKDTPAEVWPILAHALAFQYLGMFILPARNRPFVFTVPEEDYCPGFEIPLEEAFGRPVMITCTPRFGPHAYTFLDPQFIEFIDSQTPLLVFLNVNVFTKPVEAWEHIKAKQAEKKTKWERDCARELPATWLNRWTDQRRRWNEAIFYGTLVAAGIIAGYLIVRLA